MQPYTRPELTASHKAEVRREVLKFENRSKAEVMIVLSMLLIEMVRLWAECNEHRAARGFDLMPWELEKRG